MASEDERLADTADLPKLGSSAVRQAERTPSLQVQVDFGALSHRGRVRPNNEDYYLVARFGRSMHTVITNLPEDVSPAHHQEVGYGMVVADGMGGTAAGEVASRSAIQTLVELVHTTPDWMLSLDGTSAEVVMGRMAERFRLIDEVLIQKARSDADLTGMGTTMTLVCTLGLEGIVCHIGDSRAYRFRRGTLRQLTHDMSIAQRLVDQGVLTPAQAATNRLRHILTQCLGGGTVSAEVLHLQLEDGDRLLLCSDGLTEMVTDSQIAEIMTNGGTPAQTADMLVDRALHAGGKDNITVVLAEYRVQHAA